MSKQQVEFQHIYDALGAARTHAADSQMAIVKSVQEKTLRQKTLDLVQDGISEAIASLEDAQEHLDLLYDLWRR